ncbi:MAG: Rv3654c family TadE-like protein [Candidatus Nanopelagicales bacterium]
MSARERDAPSAEEGSMTVNVVFFGMLLAFVFATVMVVESVIATQVRVAQAADLAALSAAAKVWSGEQAACAEAARIASAHEVAVAQCRTEGLDVQIEVTAPPDLPLAPAVPGARNLRVSAVARAGPPPLDGL